MTTKQDFIRDALLENAKGLATEFMSSMKAIGYVGGFYLAEETGIPGKPAAKVDIMIAENTPPIIITLTDDAEANERMMSSIRESNPGQAVLGLCDHHAAHYFSLPDENVPAEQAEGNWECSQRIVQDAEQAEQGGYRQFDVDHRDNGPLHRLHVAWAIEELLTINTFMAAMQDFSRVSASLIVASVAEEKLAKCQEDAAWYEAAALIESGENLESWLSLARRNHEG